MQNKNTEREFGWDDTIHKDGTDFIVLPAGDYHFTVVKFERGRFAGSQKMPACNQAKLELKIHAPEHGDVTVFHNLFLHTKTEGLLSNFFAAIGQKRKGEPLRMNWNAVIGAQGRLKLEINTFKGNDGADKTNNQVKSFYAYDAAPSAPSQPQQQQPYSQPPQQTYQPPQQQQQAYQQQPPQYNQPPFQGQTGQQQPPQQGGWAPGQF